LRLNEKYLGTDHPEVSENLNALGMISKKRGRYDEAEAFYSRSLSIIEKVYGSEHPKVALYVHNLGVVYRKLKLWDKSWSAYERALNINKKLFNEEHELVAGNLNGYALFSVVTISCFNSLT
jgi:tetratricopeptide (TPR) repeat protein